VELGVSVVNFFPTNKHHRGTETHRVTQREMNRDTIWPDSRLLIPCQSC